MNTNQLEYFVAAAEFQNFTKAAEKYYISQTAVTQQIKSLEAQLGVSLFKRSGRHIQLTPAGQIYLDEARLIIQHVRNAEQKVRLASNGFTGDISIGFLKGCEQLGFSAFISDFKELFPGISFQFRRDDYASLFESLIRHEYDYIINIRPNKLLNPNLAFMDYNHARQYVVLYPDHPLFRRSSVLRKELKEERFIFPRTSEKSMLQIQEGFLPWFFLPEHYIYTQDMESVLLMISIRQGIGIFPEYDLYLLSGFPSLRAVPLENDRIDIALFWDRTNENIAAGQFRAFLSENIAFRESL